jgi:tRNA 2-thiouridine synthesizing protein A
VAAFARIIREAGFAAVTFSGQRYDSFSDAPQASSAAAFGTQGVNIWAIKPAGERPTSVPEESEPAGGRAAPTAPTISAAELPRVDEVYDAGALGCADGPLLHIASALKRLPPGAVLEVRATDSGVAADLPAWCRMVGHTYLGEGRDEHRGRFFIRRKHG